MKPGRPQVLVLAPTRELVQQIAEVVEGAAGYCGLGCLAVTGGVPKKPQARALHRSPALLIATPGRLEDLVADGSCRRVRIVLMLLLQSAGSSMLDVKV